MRATSPRAQARSRREETMRVMAAAVTAVALAAAAMPAITAARADDAEVERLVRQHVQPMLIAAGGMAVAGPNDGPPLVFHHGMARVARKGAITTEVLFHPPPLTPAFPSPRARPAGQASAGPPP